MIAASPTTIQFQTTVSSNAGLIEGYKRVEVTLYDGETEQSWSEDHADVFFENGVGTITLTSLEADDLDLTSPHLSLLIDGIEQVLTFNLHAVPYAMYVPSLYDGSQSLVLSDLDVFDAPYYTQSELAEEAPTPSIDYSWILNAPDIEEGFDEESEPTFNGLFLSEFLSVGTDVTDYMVNVAGTVNAQGLVLDNPPYYTQTELGTVYGGAEGPIDFSWLKNVPAGSSSSTSVRGIVEDMVTGNTELGIEVTVTDYDGVQKLDFDVNDPLITIDGAVSGNAVMTNLGDVTITTEFNGLLGVDYGGTGASNASNARTNLDAQQQDDDLDDLAALTVEQDSFIVGNGISEWDIQTPSEVRSTLGLNTDDLPTFAGVNLEGPFTITGHDMTVSGDATITGNIYLWQSLYVPVYGSEGEFLFWDEADGPSGPSDQNLKENITEISSASDLINAINGYSFDWRYDEFPGRHLSHFKEYGVIAQEVQEVMPDVIRYDKDGYLRVDYMQLIPVLVEAFQEQESRINELEARLNDLEGAE